MTSALPESNTKPLKIPISVMVLVYSKAVVNHANGNDTNDTSDTNEAVGAQLNASSNLRVLLLERADIPGFWQSVTGSVEQQDINDPLGLRRTAARELCEETGIAVDPSALDDWRIENRFLIYPQFRHRYPLGTTHNTEHVFALSLPEPISVTLAPREHLQHVWLPWQEAANRVRSWSNRDAIERLPYYAIHHDMRKHS
jgi:dihydroneopterin triphosphate diphosphatase